MELEVALEIMVLVTTVVYLLEVEVGENGSGILGKPSMVRMLGTPATWILVKKRRRY